MKAIAFFSAASVLALSTATANAQSTSSDDNAGTPDTIVVTGQNTYRDRTNDINPTLSYDLDFFQRFEPSTVGEMLKRTPGVTFTSDVLEYDGVQMRGLGAEYSQIMINGRKVPGQGADRSFFVDRIPAELVENIEIIRSPSADMSSEGVAGTLNIILKDGASLEGVLARIGATYYGDGDNALRPSAALAVAGDNDNYDYWLGFNVQQRRNPKEKIEEYYDDGELEGFAFEDDTRNGTDYSLNGSIGFNLPEGGELRFNGYAVYTDRTEKEFVEEYEGTVIDRDQGDIVAIAQQNEDIDQTSMGFDALYSVTLGEGQLEITAGAARFNEDTVNTETEEEFEDGVSQGVEEDDETLDIEDTEYFGGASYTTKLGGLELKTGLDAKRSERTGLQAGLLFDTEADIEETIFAPFIKLTRELASNVTLEGGLRYDISERDISSEDGDGSSDSQELLPSASLRWDVTSQDRITISAARTLRRPDFDLVTPFEEDETPDDEDITIGNPDLENELSWGFDAGYEHRLPGRGIAGVNFFYRDVQDVIELTDTGEDTEAGGAFFVPQNIGDGQAWGLEFDISTPLDFIGLPNTGFYANYAYLDSEVEDPFTGQERKFRNQPDYVYNISLTQDLPQLGGGAGLSYQKRGESLETEFQEQVITEYDGNLELFFEKNLGQDAVLRFTGTNLLDQEKLEFIRDFGDEFDNEIQREQSSPTFTVTLRAAL